MNEKDLKVLNASLILAGLSMIGMSVYAYKAQKDLDRKLAEGNKLLEEHSTYVQNVMKDFTKN